MQHRAEAELSRELYDLSFNVEAHSLLAVAYVRSGGGERSGKYGG